MINKIFCVLWHSISCCTYNHNDKWYHVNLKASGGATFIISAAVYDILFWMKSNLANAEYSHFIGEA